MNSAAPIITKNLQETGHISQNFVEYLEKEAAKRGKTAGVSGATVVGLYGDLGSGKTSFMQGVGRALGVTEDMVSPTFVIEKIYKLKDRGYEHLIHIDAYRIEKSDEMLHLGWREILENEKNLICIEWPEKIADIMPKDHMRIKFTFIDEQTREIVFESRKETGEI